MAFNIQKIHQIQKRGAQLSPCYHKCESPIKPPPPPGPRLDVSANGIRIGRFLLTHFVRVRIMEQANVRDVRDGTIASQQRPSSTDPLRSPVSSRSLFLVLLICLPGFSSVNPPARSTADDGCGTSKRERGLFLSPNRVAIAATQSQTLQLGIMISSDTGVQLSTDPKFII